MRSEVSIGWTSLFRETTSSRSIRLMRAINCPLRASVPFPWRQPNVTHLWQHSLTRICPPFKLLHSCKVLLKVRGLCPSLQTLVIPWLRHPSMQNLHPVLCPEILSSISVDCSLIRVDCWERPCQISRLFKEMQLNNQICCIKCQAWNWASSTLSLLMHPCCSRYRTRFWCSNNLSQTLLTFWSCYKVNSEQVLTDFWPQVLMLFRSLMLRLLKETVFTPSMKPA